MITTTSTTTTNIPTSSVGFSITQHSAIMTNVSTTIDKSTGSSSTGQFSHVTPTGSRAKATQSTSGVVTLLAGVTLPTRVSIKPNLNQVLS